MNINLAAAARIVPFTALMLSACVSQSSYDAPQAAKGFGDTHPVASNDAPADRAKNRGIVITAQGPGGTAA